MTYKETDNTLTLYNEDGIALITYKYKVSNGVLIYTTPQNESFKAKRSLS